jgi:hypothetical protein
MANLSIATAALQDDAVTSVKIANDAVTSLKIANGAVTSAKILDGTIATVDLADSSVNSLKIADATVGTIDLADGSITSVKLAANAVNNTTLIAPSTIVEADLDAALQAKVNAVGGAATTYLQPSTATLIGPNNPPTTLTVSCLAGDVVIGGGARPTTLPHGNPPLLANNFKTIYSGPVSTTQWEVLLQSLTNSNTFTAYAVCLDL